MSAAMMKVHMKYWLGVCCGGSVDVDVGRGPPRKLDVIGDLDDERLRKVRQMRSSTSKNWDTCSLCPIGSENVS